LYLEKKESRKRQLELGCLIPRSAFIVGQILNSISTLLWGAKRVCVNHFIKKKIEIRRKETEGPFLEKKHTHTKARHKTKQNRPLN
jgi:hypothetical protein